MMDFVAIDVETANPDMASICQIGIASYRNGQLWDEWVTFLDPDDYFDDLNVSIHGIDESTVQGAPRFSDVAGELWRRLGDSIVVCHTHFDRVSIGQACARFDLRPPPLSWLDSSRIARRTWKEVAWRGYGLYALCERLGYSFKHHDALEDAKASAHVLLAAVEKSGLDLDLWIRRVRQPIDPTGASISRDGNPEGPLYGETLVFTGALAMPRREAADLAAAIGCSVASNVSKKVTMLVVGDQDISKLAGHEKSAKQRKAEKLIADGASIRIMKETDFKEVVRLVDEIV
jgi:DNA polymerase-3 subunit epsilon